MTILLNYLHDAGKKPALFAKEVGVEPSTITRIIRGERKPSVDLAKRISSVTGISIADLRPDIFGTPPATSPEAA